MFAYIFFALAFINTIYITLQASLVQSFFLLVLAPAIVIVLICLYLYGNRAVMGLFAVLNFLAAIAIDVVLLQAMCLTLGIAAFWCFYKNTHPAQYKIDSGTLRTINKTLNASSGLNRWPILMLKIAASIVGLSMTFVVMGTFKGLVSEGHYAALPVLLCTSILYILGIVALWVNFKRHHVHFLSLFFLFDLNALVLPSAANYSTPLLFITNSGIQLLFAVLFAEQVSRYYTSTINPSSGVMEASS